MATASLLRAAERTASALLEVRYALAATASSFVVASARSAVCKNDKALNFMIFT
jgi:hypothetical protein